MAGTYKYVFDKVEEAFLEWKKVKSVKKPGTGTRIQGFPMVLDYVEGLDLTPLKNFIKSEPDRPIVFFGAGGANSSAVYAAQICQLNGIMAVAKTSLGVNMMSADLMKKSKFVAMTASGHTIDIFETAEKLLKVIPAKDFCCVTLKEETDAKNKLAKMLKEKYPDSVRVCFDGHFPDPTGKKPYLALFSHDEFVGTKKHLAYFAIMYRCFYDDSSLKDLIFNENEEPYTAELQGKTLSDITYFNIIHGGLGEAAAADLETRLAEGSLAFPMVTDLKNFTRGRHAFYKAHEDNTAVIVLETGVDERLAEKIISLYHHPQGKKPVSMAPIPFIRIRSTKTTPLATIELLAKSMFFALDLAVALGVDLSSPEAPSLGVWELGYADYMDYNKM